MEALEAASIIRLRHCQKEIFCLSVPEACPGCGEELRASRLQEAPVSLPNPLCNGHKTSCCLLQTDTQTGRQTDRSDGGCIFAER
uniref:MKRN2 opposite strand protein-like N-terminal domain-containing protein n=1 Tax=Myripristis murdjan TaxID=586833 RepID=A0A667YUW2_9TELE